ACHYNDRPYQYRQVGSPPRRSEMKDLCKFQADPFCGLAPEGALWRFAGSPLFPPALEFLENLGTAAALAVDGPGAEAIFFFYIIFRPQELKVPYRVRRLLVPADPTAAGRVREADALGTVEHQQEQMLAEEPVIEWLIVSQRRQVAE